MIKSKLASFKKYIKMDFHILATLISRSWSILANGVTIIMMPLFMSSVDQGYYYTFASLIGIQMLFELGLGQVIMQLVSHDMAHLKYIENKILEGSVARINNLTELLKLLKYWYIGAAILFALLAGFGGAAFLASNGEINLDDWIFPWLILIIATAINLSFIPSLSFLEGCGQIGQVAQMRLTQSIIGSVLLWVMLFMGMGLWAACMMPLSACIYTAFWLRKFNGVHKWLTGRKINSNNKNLNWFRDIFPFQWRIALSSLSGYFIFYAFTPIIFSKSGAEAAGKFGIAMAIFNALGSVGSSWAHAKTPLMSMHISKGERHELNRVFDSVLKSSIIFTFISAFSIVIGVKIMNMIGLLYSNRISDVEILICLAVVSVANSVIFSVAAYMRAHKEEPLLLLSVFGATAALLIAYFTASYSIFLLSFLYACMTLFVLLPWSIFLYLKYRSR
jgi:O-antigen/teichoic acid export membrane protein